MPSIVRLTFRLERSPMGVYPSQLHGLFFNLLPQQVAERVHKHNKKPFSLWLENIEGERLKLEAGLLEDGLLPPLLRGYYFPERELKLAGVALGPIKPNGLKELKAQTYEELLKGKVYKRISLEFIKPTSFNRYRMDYPLPEPSLVFESLLKRWNAFASEKLSEEGFIESVLRYVAVENLEGRTETVELSEGIKLRGFVGSMSLVVKEQKVAQVLSPLCRFSAYAGVGRKTTMDMGRVKCRGW